MTDEQWFVIPVNPYPWKTPPFTPARVGKKLIVKAGRDEGLHSYKQSIAEYVKARPHEMIEGPIKLDFWFYRNIGEYQTHQARTARKHEADTTNLQKATEDALQGILYKNDKDVVIVKSWRVEQSPNTKSLLVVRVVPFSGAIPIFPEDVQYEISNVLADKPYDGPAANLKSDEEIPF